MTDRKNKRKFQTPYLDWLELLVWENNKLLRIEPDFPRRSFFTFKLKSLPGLNNQSAEINISLKEELDAIDDLALLSVVEGERLNPNRADANLIYTADLESTIVQILQREFPSVEIIETDRLNLLRRLMETLTHLYPGRIHINEELYRINLFVQDETIIQIHYSDWDEIVSNLSIISDEWVGCIGSEPQFRGFPCGLWTLFHLLTTQSVRLDYDYRIVPNIIFDYVTTVFSCRVCGDNFIMEENIFQIHELTSNKDSVIWLWKLHNKVNERLQDAASEDPVVAKFQYPPKWICDNCSKYNPKLKSRLFSEDHVFTFLMNKYSPNSVKDHFLQEMALKPRYPNHTTTPDALTEEELHYLKMLDAHHAEF